MPRDVAAAARLMAARRWSMIQTGGESIQCEGYHCWNEATLDFYALMRQVFGTRDADIPDFSHALFVQLYGRQFRKGVDLAEVSRNLGAHRITTGEVFDEFLALIAHSPHAALYAGIGIDPALSEAMINGDHVPRRGEAGGRARAMAAFAEALLDSSSQFIVAQLRALEMSDDLEQKLAIRIFDPWADSPRLAFLAEGGLREAMQEIEELLESLRRD